jgi:hypothetical protein
MAFHPASAHGSVLLVSRHEPDRKVPVVTFSELAPGQSSSFDDLDPQLAAWFTAHADIEGLLQEAARLRHEYTEYDALPWSQITKLRPALGEQDALSRRSRARFRSRVRAREPIEWSAPGVGNRKDEHVLIVLFERDHVREPVDGRLADHQASGVPARPAQS